MKIEYVLGFMFDESLEHFVALRKNKPEWQKGKLNGVGGKVEATDLGYPAAMSREFAEETGVEVPATNWKPVCNLHFEDAFVAVFACVGPIDLTNTTTEEEVYVLRAKGNDLPYNALPNLRWLVPMSKNALGATPTKTLDIFERP